MCSNFHLEVRGEGTATVLRLYGELDSVSYPVLEEQLGRLRGGGSVIVDLGSLAFVDARGLDALLRARDDAQRRGVELGVVNAGSQVCATGCCWPSPTSTATGSPPIHTSREALRRFTDVLLPRAEWIIPMAWTRTSFGWRPTMRGSALTAICPQASNCHCISAARMSSPP
jgi:anti-anti-sigma factor